MKCEISQVAYNALKTATLAGDIVSFCFRAVHKGLEFSMESKYSNSEYKKWEDMLNEIYFDNDLPEVIGFYPRIVENEFVVDADYSVFFNHIGESYEEWSMVNFLNYVGFDLNKEIGWESRAEDILLDLSMSASSDENLSFDTYSLYCVHPETGQEYDLTSNQGLKNMVKVYVYYWAKRKCDNAAYSFFIEIKESMIDEFYENVSERVEFEIV